MDKKSLEARIEKLERQVNPEPLTIIFQHSIITGMNEDGSSILERDPCGDTTHIITPERMNQCRG